MKELYFDYSGVQIPPAAEYLYRLKSGLNIDFELLSADPLLNSAGLKYSGTFDGTFFYGRLASGPHALRSFYDRVFQAIVIFDGQADSYPILDEQISDDFRAYLDNLDSQYTWLGRVKFVKRTYCDLCRLLMEAWIPRPADWLSLVNDHSIKSWKP